MSGRATIEKFVFAVTFNDFLIELSVARRRDRLINARIRLALRVYLSQSENGTAPYNEIYGCHRRGLHAGGFRRSARRVEEEEESGSPIGTGCNNYYRISIRLSFASLHIEPPPRRKKRGPGHYTYASNKTTRTILRTRLCQLSPNTSLNHRRVRGVSETFVETSRASPLCRVDTTDTRHFHPFGTRDVSSRFPDLVSSDL